jgi:hypothetical protein
LPPSNALIIASSSIKSPRSVFTIVTPCFILSNSAKPRIRSVEGVSARWREITLEVEVEISSEKEKNVAMREVARESERGRGWRLL